MTQIIRASPFCYARKSGAVRLYFVLTTAPWEKRKRTSSAKPVLQHLEGRGIRVQQTVASENMFFIARITAAQHGKGACDREFRVDPLKIDAASIFRETIRQEGERSRIFTSPQPDRMPGIGRIGEKIHKFSIPAVAFRDIGPAPSSNTSKAAGDAAFASSYGV